VKGKRVVLCAVPVVRCAILAVVLAALFTVSGARAQDVFSAGSTAATSGSSGKTGTQGVNGNPFCPPPVIFVDGVATTPRNWSCRGDAQSNRTNPRAPDGVAGGRSTVKPVDPYWDSLPQNVPRPAPADPNGGMQGQAQNYRKPPVPIGQISPGYDSEYQCTRTPPMPKGQISPGYDAGYQCTRRAPMPAGMIGTGYDSTYHCTRIEPMPAGMIGTG
jgi:hypothetical protein